MGELANLEEGEDHRSNEFLRSKVREWFERVWNWNDADSIDAFMWPDCVCHGYGFEFKPNFGTEDFLRLRAQMALAFPDLQVEVKQIVVDGDLTVARYVAYGTHTGDLDGVKAKGRKFRFDGMQMARWREGRVVEIWSKYDQLGLLQQIGYIKQS